LGRAHEIGERLGSDLEPHHFESHGDYYVGNFRNQSDPLLVYAEEALGEVLFAIHKREIEAAPRPTKIGPSWSDMFNMCGGRIMETYAKLRYSDEVGFEQTPQGTRIRLGQVNGVDPERLALFIHFQRLAVLLLSLVLGNRINEVDQQELDYVDLEFMLRARGLSDQPGLALSSCGEQWNTLASAIEVEMVRQKAGAMPVSDDLADTKLWKLQRKMLGMTVATDLVVTMATATLEKLAALAKVVPPKDSRNTVVLLVGEADAKTAETLMTLGQIGIHGATAYMLMNASVARGADEAFEKLTKLYDAVKIPAPKRTEGEPTSLSSFLAPRVSMSWLANWYVTHMRAAKVQPRA